MNWEAIGAIGEVGGTIAVVATLIVLYRQIKLSSDITKAQMDTMAKDQLAHLTLQAVVTPDLARIIEIAHSSDPSSLTEDEVRRAYWWYTSYGTILEGMFLRREAGQLSEDMWVGEIRTDYAGSDSFARWCEMVAGRNDTLLDKIQSPL